MKIYRLHEAQDNTKNYIILSDGEGLAKMIDWDLSEEEIEELVKEFEQVGSSLESRVECDWMDEDDVFGDTFAIEELGSITQLK